MFYIVEHDMGLHQIIDTKGKANKYGKQNYLIPPRMLLSGCQDIIKIAIMRSVDPCLDQ